MKIKDKIEYFKFIPLKEADNKKKTLFYLITGKNSTLRCKLSRIILIVNLILNLFLVI